MSSTATHVRTISIEDMQVDHRYVPVADWAEANYIVDSVDHYKSECLVMRNGEWVPMDLVRVTYSHGATMTHELGTPIAIMCDEVAR